MRSVSFRRAGAAKPSLSAFALCIAVATPVSAQELPERDDATGRIRARLQRDGVRTVEEQSRILEEAAREAAKWSIGQPRLRNAATRAGAVPPGTWINVGPAAGTQVSPLLEVASDSGRLRKIVPHPTDPNILYVATAGGGVWKTFDAQTAITATTGPRWTSITSGIGSQSVGAFAVDPNSPDTLFLGLGDPFDVESPGFYTSADGGATWKGPVNLVNGSGTTATSVRDIVVDPSGTGAVVVATNAGLFRQIEGGLWTSKDLGALAPGDCWSVAWVGSMTWLATCGGQVFRSADNGVSWAASNSNLPVGSLGRLTLAAAMSDRANPATAWVYLLAANAAGSAQYDVFLSQNGGVTWSALSMNAASICISPGTPGCPLNATTDQPDLDVMHDQAWYNQAILVDPRDHGKLFVAGNVSMIRSDDAGQTWRVMTDWLPASPLCSPNCTRLPYVHADWHAMAVSVSQTALPSYCGLFPNGTATTVPAGTPCFHAGTDGGLFRSADVFTAVPASDNSSGTPHFEGRIGRGLVTHLAYSIATDLHDSTNTTMIGGLQDNGTRLRISGSTTFNQVIGADGFAVGIGKSGSTAADPSCRNRWGSLLLGTIYGVIYSSVDCGLSFASAMTGICKPQSQFLNPAGGCNVDYGSNFFMKLTSDQADPSGLTFITVINNSACSANQTSCARAYGTNTVYATHDGAASTGGWSNANGAIHLVNGATVTNFPYALRSVSANSLHAGQWAVTDSSTVFVTFDGGANWKQSATLQGRVTGAAFEGATGQAIWVATRGSGGAWLVARSADGGMSWVDKSGDLPAVPANVVTVDPNDAQTIYLGTEIGLYVSRNGGQNWTRAGGGSLPLVSVTEINVALDSSAVRVSTYGRGFWELYPSANAPTGVYGNGDFDRNQLIDGFDLVREAAVLGLSAADSGYDPTGNLTGPTNVIDAADWSALVAKMGGRP